MIRKMLDWVQWRWQKTFPVSYSRVRQWLGPGTGGAPMLEEKSSFEDDWRRFVLKEDDGSEP